MEAYLSFNGNGAEALAFYAKALDGKVAYTMTFGESPMGDQTPAADRNKLMHGMVEARGHRLMASDLPPGMAFEGYKGFSITVQAKTVDEGRKLFDALSAGGKVTMAYAPTFWSHGFGMLEDKFGVPWMVNCEQSDMRP